MRMQKCEQPRCRRVFIYRAPRRRETTDRGCSRTLMERRIGRSCGIFRGIPGIFIKASMQRSGNHVRAGAPFSCACDSGRATRRARGYAGFRTPLNARRRCQRQSCYRRLHEQSARPTTVAQAPQRECWQWTLCCGEVFQSRPPAVLPPSLLLLFLEQRHDQLEAAARFPSGCYASHMWEDGGSFSPRHHVS
jgi:hypothetical protein